MRNPVTLSAIAALALLLVGCSPSASEDTTPESPKPVEVEEAPGVGVPLVDGDVEFVVNSVECSTEPMSDGNYAPLPPKGQFCKVNVDATALADIGMFLGDITITTAQINGEVTPAVGAMMYAGSLTADYISEGQTLTGNVVFDIAADDAVATVLLKANPMTEGVVVPVQ